MICKKHSNWSYDFYDDDEKLVIKQRNCEWTYSIKCAITKEMFIAMYEKWIKNEELNIENEVEKMTYDDLLDKFSDTFPFAKINDYRPICHELFTDGKVGITIWLENGDVIEYYPKQLDEV